jgi:hypothetical protein
MKLCLNNGECVKDHPDTMVRALCDVKGHTWRGNR